MDKKDRKIIELLDQDSSASFTELSHKLTLSKQSVQRRVEKLSKSRLFSYFTVINYFKLGLSNSVIYLNLSGCEANILKRKIEEIKKIKQVGWIAEIFGKHDLGISVFYVSLLELNEIISKIQSILGMNINSIKIFSVIENYSFSFSFEHSERKHFRIYKPNKEVFLLSEIQRKILGSISKSPRAKNYFLSQELKVSPGTIRYNLLELMKSRIIMGYKLLIDFNVLKYQWGQCVFSCGIDNNYELMIKKLKNDSRVSFFSRTVENDLIVDCLYHHVDELKSFVEEYRKEFKFIFNTEILNIVKIHKLEPYFRN